MEQNFLDFVIGTHAQNDVHGGTAVSIQRLYAKGYKFFWDLRGAGGAARTRNITCTKFLQQKPAPYLIFIDRDIVFEPNDIKCILEDLKTYELVGGCYAVKDATQLASYGIEGNGGITLDGYVHEVIWLATGFMGIRLELLEKMVKELNLPLMHEGQWSEAYPFFGQRPFNDGTNWIWLTEDYDFCDKARQVGVKPYIDTRVQVRHIGDYAYSVEDVIDKNLKNRKEQCIQLEKGRLKHLLEDTSEYLGESQGDIIQKVGTVVNKLAAAWKEYRKNGNAAEGFYRGNKLYIYDGLDQHRQDNYWKYRASDLAGIRDSSVLDIGCGIGSIAFMLTHNNNNVVGFDINDKVLDFANFRKKKHDIQGVEFVNKLPVEKLSGFDYVIATDVLEHIEDLRPLIRTLGQHMKRGAKFIHQSEFGKQKMCPMHFNHSKILPKLLEKAGFLEWDYKSYIKS